MSSSDGRGAPTASVAAPGAQGAPPAPSFAVPEEERLGRQGWLAVGAIVAVMAALILPAIGRKSLWRDEGFSMSTVLRPWRSFFEIVYDHESNAAVHSVVLKAWSALGSSEGFLRLPSAIAVIAAVVVVALVANTLANRKVAIVAALLFACHGSVFAYGQQIRAYSFTVLFASLAALAFTLDVRRPSNRLLVGWVVASLLLTYSNLFAVTLVVAQLASLFALPSGHRDWRRRGAAGAVIIGLTLPLALLISTHNEGGLYELGLGTLWDVLMVFTGRSGLVGIVGMAVLGVVGLRSTVGVVRRGGATFERWVHVFCLTWIAGPLLMALVGTFVEPVLSGRYLMISVPGIAIYGAIGLVDLFRSFASSSTVGRIARIGAATAVAIASIAGVTVWLIGAEVENWRGASKLVFAEAREGDVVLFANDSVRLFFEYYRVDGIDDPSTAPTPAFPPQPWGGYETGDHQYVSFDADVVDRVASTADRIWVVVGRDHVSTGGVDAALQAGLGATHELVEQRELNGRVEVLLYERR